MNYEDGILIRLAYQPSRSTLFDDLALEQLVTATYKTDLLTVEGPYQPIFNELQLGSIMSAIILSVNLKNCKVIFPKS